MEKVVESTNNSSILSKYSMVSAGYFEDEYLQFFIEKKAKRAPLINLGYFVRACTIDTSISNFLNYSKDKPLQVISLGSGFDTTFFRHSTEFFNMRFFEIDLPGVVKRKIELIRNCPKLMSKIVNPIFGSGNEIASQNYSLFAHDLNNLDTLENKLHNFQFEFNTSTLIFSECAITYLEEAESTNIIQWARKRIPKSVFITFEQMNPDDAFGHVMTSHFIKIQSPLKSISTYKTIHQQIQRFLNAGWNCCKGVSAMEVMLKLMPLEKLRENLRREPFDEFEEWHLKCCHYALIIASRAEFNEYCRNFISKFITNDLYHNEGESFISLQWESVPDITVERYGHCCLAFDDESFFIIGGFGNNRKKHSRLKNVLWFSLKDNAMSEILPDTNNVEGEEPPVWDCMYSTCTMINNEEFVIYGGRTSPLLPVNCRPWVCRINWPKELGSSVIVPVGSTLSGGSICKRMEPQPRWRHSAITIEPGKILIYGGLTLGITVLGDLWQLNIHKNYGGEGMKLSWDLLRDNSIPEESPSPSFSHSAIAYQGTMYISGGLDKFLLPLAQLWTYRIDQGWRRIKTIPQLRPRYSHTSHISSNKKLFLLGGVNISREKFPELAIICLNNRTVTEYQLLMNNPEYPILMLHNHTSIYLEENNSLYTVGGGGNCFSFGTSINKQLARICIS